MFTASWATDYLRKAIAAAREEGLPYSSSVADGISDYLGNGSERAQKISDEIRKTVSTRLSLWNNPRIAAATETSDFDISRLRYDEPVSIYVAVSPADIERLQPLLSLFFQTLIQVRHDNPVRGTQCGHRTGHGPALQTTAATGVPRLHEPHGEAVPRQGHPCDPR